MKLWHCAHGHWASYALASRLAICNTAGGDLHIDEARAPSAQAALLRVPGGPAGSQAVLVAARGADVRVGAFAALPVTVLGDRDEITVAGQRLLFTAYDEPAARAYEAGPFETRCARCKLPFQGGEPVTQCPACPALYHTAAGGDEADAAMPAGGPRGCDLYDDQCAACSQRRSEMLWTPAEGAVDVA